MKTELGLVIHAPAVSDDDIARLCEWLAGKGWVRASEIVPNCIGLDDRMLRAIASASGGRILSGQKGYRIFDDTTPIGEAEHAADWIRSQARKMDKRASEIERLIHNRRQRERAA